MVIGQKSTVKFQEAHLKITSLQQQITPKQNQLAQQLKQPMV